MVKHCHLVLMSAMVLDRVGFCPLCFSSLYGRPSKKLKCNTGCVLRSHTVNHMLYVDVLSVFSPCSGGLQQLLNICNEYGRQMDVTFNPQKSVRMILRNQKSKMVHSHMLYWEKSTLRKYRSSGPCGAVAWFAFNVLLRLSYNCFHVPFYNRIL